MRSYKFEKVAYVLLVEDFGDNLPFAVHLDERMEVSESEAVPVFENHSDCSSGTDYLHNVHFILGFRSCAKLRDCGIQIVNTPGAKSAVEVAVYDCVLTSSTCHPKIV